MEREQGAAAAHDDEGSTTRRSVGRATRERSARRRKSPVDEQEARRQLAASKKLYYRIGEVSELTGVKAHVLRYWETEFRWMAPPKSRSKQRLYRKRDIEFVWLLKRLLWDQRYTIAGARQRIQDLGLEEALSRCADAQSLDDVLAADRSGLGDGAEAARTGGPPANASPEESTGTARSSAPDAATAIGDPASTLPGSGGQQRVDWPALRAALASMQSELLALRGSLQQGL